MEASQQIIQTSLIILFDTITSRANNVFISLAGESHKWV